MIHLSASTTSVSPHNTQYSWSLIRIQPHNESQSSRPKCPINYDFTLARINYYYVVGYDAISSMSWNGQGTLLVM